MNKKDDKKKPINTVLTVQDVRHVLTITPQEDKKHGR